MNIQAMMKQAQKLQKDMMKQKEEIEAITHSKNRSSCSKSVKMVLMMKACSVY